MSDNEELRSKLKKLPVPTLAHTSEELKKWTALYEGAENYQHVVDDFFEGELSKKLQEKLEEVADNQENSWLNPFWLEKYLKTRGALQSTSNFSLVIEPTYINKSQTLGEITAHMITNFTSFYTQIVTDTLPYEQTPKGDYVDMYFYQNFLKSARIPREEKDQHYIGSRSNNNNFIIFICRGIMYKVPVTDKKGEQLLPQQIATQLDEIIQNNQKSDEHIASYTGLPRDESARYYQELKKDPTNQQNLQDIEDSLLVISYSEKENATQSDRIKESLVGPTDKYFSKTVQATINKNKELYVAFEHSYIDGLPTLTLITEIMKRKNKADGYSKETPSYQALSWQIDTEMKGKLTAANDYCNKVATSLDIADGVFEQWGKDRIKTLGVSPDAFFHVALNLASYRVYKERKSIYEPVAMRAFYQGRTESARSLNEGKWTFARLFDEDNASKEVVEAFEEGVKEHGRRAKLCQQGLGVERHLFGLEKMFEALYPGEEQPKVFRHPALKAMQSDVISSSGIPFDVMNAFVFGPSNEEGFGVFYGILKDKILLTTSSNQGNRTTSEEMNQQIHQALLDVAEWREGNS